MPENPNYPEIDITEHEYVHIWGVVTYVIHKLQHRFPNGLELRLQSLARKLHTFGN